MKHINNGFAYIVKDGKTYTVSWQVQVDLEGVEVTHFAKKEVRHMAHSLPIVSPSLTHHEE